jgi:hypothetical protein
MRPSMRCARLSPVLALATAAFLLTLAAAASADSPLDQYQRTGKIDPCTPGLYGGGAAPNDVAQYAPDYLQALDDAKRQGCHHGGGGGSSGNTGPVAAPASGNSTGGPPGAPAGTPYVPKPPAPPKAASPATPPRAFGGHLPLAVKSDGGTPAPVIALAIMALLGLAGAALLALSRRLGWTLPLLDPVRHAGGEAALRMGSAAGSLADWARELPRRRP